MLKIGFTHSENRLGTGKNKTPEKGIAINTSDKDLLKTFFVITTTCFIPAKSSQKKTLRRGQELKSYSDFFLCLI